jgi:spore coat polysaccharide biosynthesis predicted glycosyltransferase SpsG
MIKEIYFHANASQLKGSGHVMRMYALAEEAKSRNLKTIFLGEISNIPWITANLLSKVFDEIVQLNDTPTLTRGECILIWDSYHLSESTLRILKFPFEKKFLIADSVTPNQLADGVILLEESREWKQYLTELDIPHITGRELIPLRKSHQVGKKFKTSSKSENLKILISAGGVDYSSFVKPLSYYILKNFPAVKVYAITNSTLGLRNEHFVQIAPTQDFDNLLAETDLAISSAGSSIFEILSRRIPSGFVLTAPNQESNRKFLIQANLSIEVGIFNGTEFIVNKESLSLLINDFKIRKSLQKASSRLIKGLGAVKIIDYVLNQTKKL